MYNLNQVEYDLLKAIINDNPEDFSSIISEKSYFLTQELKWNLKVFFFTRIESVVCYFRAIQCFDILKNYGINFHSRECIKAATIGGSLEIFRQLNLTNQQLIEQYENSTYPGFTLPFTAAKYGNIDLLKYMFLKIDSKIYEGCCKHLLIFAAKYAQIDCINFILNSSIRFEKKSIPPKFIKILCNAMLDTKVTEIFTFFYNRFNTPQLREIFRKYIFHFDAVQVFIKEYDIKSVSQEMVDRLTFYRSDNILNYLIYSGVVLPISNTIDTLFRMEYELL